ncbi:trna (adenine37-n(6))-methyltransferase trmn6 [hydrocarbon metagenome]|uniref:Trna (Adenine37-n(6))-methyltransferase trmn6 n=1 Tax=hydrocarbon metagenome TaxID=938273 RepID=A0A0W8E8J9_9ZZZZ
MERFLVRDDETLDDLLLGNMKIIQPQKGYRFSIDSVLIAYFADLQGVQEVVDLGTGSGVIPLLLSYRNPYIKITGVELIETVAQRANRNILYNGLSSRIRILEADIKNLHHLLPPGGVDLVISNPPFWKKGEGRISKNQEQAVARHELIVDLPQIIKTAGYLLHSAGKLCIIHRADRLEEILKYLNENQLNRIRMRMVQPFQDKPANLVLVEAQKSTLEEISESIPLVIYKQRGVYSEEIQTIYARN